MDIKRASGLFFLYRRIRKREDVVSVRVRGYRETTKQIGQTSKQTWKLIRKRLIFVKSIKSDTMYMNMRKLLKILSIVILILISIVITFDSGLFIYPSLSNSLFFSILISLLALATGIYAICYSNNGKLPVNCYL